MVRRGIAVMARRRACRLQVCRQRRHVIGILLREFGTALNIGKEKGDRAGGEIGHHWLKGNEARQLPVGVEWFPLGSQHPFACNEGALGALRDSRCVFVFTRQPHSIMCAFHSTRASSLKL